MVHTTLVPLDGTEFGEQTLPTATAIARRAGARVRLASATASTSRPNLPDTVPPKASPPCFY